MIYATQTVEAHGIVCAEYRYEPSEVEDDQPLEIPLVCGQCDHFYPDMETALNAAIEQANEDTQWKARFQAYESSQLFPKTADTNFVSGWHDGWQAYHAEPSSLELFSSLLKAITQKTQEELALSPVDQAQTVTDLELFANLPLPKSQPYKTSQTQKILGNAEPGT